MTKLNDKWKQGKLEEYKRYYCQTVWFEDIFMARCHNKGQNDEWWTLENEKYSYNNVHHIKDIEVLAEVPSFEQWQAKLEENARLEAIKEKTYNYDYLSECYSKFIKENAQLKKLLKEWLLFEKEENPHDFTIMSERMEELAKQTKEFLGDNNE